MFWSYNSLNLPSTRFPLNPEKWPANARKRSHFGQDVLWMDYDGDKGPGRHLSTDTLEPYRQIGDESFDRILALYAEENRALGPGDDLFGRVPADVKSQSEADQALQKMITQISRIPSWVDKEQLQRGQEVFLAYAPAIGLGLYYRSLVPGFSIPKIAAVLQATAYLAPPSSKTAVHQRLMDTGAFVGACLQSKDVAAILPGGDGWKAALRVRLLHAKVRRQLLLRKGGRQWDTKNLGIPINQEDMAATLLAFSTNALLGAEMLLGRPLPLSERLDYLALWRYLGWLLGVDVNDDIDDDDASAAPKRRALDPCGPGWLIASPDPMAHSYAVFQSIIMHALHPDSSSVQIAHHLLRQGRRRDGDSNNHDASKDEASLARQDTNWFYFRSIQCRRFVGDRLADALELPLRPTWWGRFFQWIFSTIHLTVFCLYTIAGLPISPLRGRLVRFHRNNLERFMEFWAEEHPRRMQEKLIMSTGTERKEKAPVCPFAMVLPADLGRDEVVGSPH
ncbi:Conserved hypothetical protein [Seminavis robusta]|uniref:ER-bound oxygenase mpaB/mpaB'/Rubber oxygenase catalytic domain-containing protein n=1 Tax=Seminavis robusta TaxID=568900 RepID=A0A9N8HN48_9STRA|nr:Conserved hypothetical protein [Seminavis robusta]|eukprot:Sro957_g224550.1 Conserved hypothetical protein (507) ;mRNA; r:26104-27624